MIYSTDTAQTLAFGMNYNAGFYAMAVNTVPEPGTLVLFGFGMAGLSAYRLAEAEVTIQTFSPN